MNGAGRSTPTRRLISSSNTPRLGDAGGDSLSNDTIPSLVTSLLAPLPPATQGRSPTPFNHGCRPPPSPHPRGGHRPTPSHHPLRSALPYIDIFRMYAMTRCWHKI